MYIATKEQLAQEILNYDTGAVVILCAEKGFTFTDIQPILRSAKVPVVGAYFPGLIAERKLQYSGFIVQHFTCETEVYSFDSKDLDSVSFKAKNIESGTGLILMDSFADGNQAFLNRLFYELGHNFRFIGSGAGSLELVQKPCIFDKDGLYENKAIVLLLHTKVSIGLKHGYDRIAGPFVATNTSDSKIFELNWENAFDCYSDIVNSDSDVPVTKEDFFAVSKGYPLGISRKGHEDIVRDPISVDNQGNLYCIDDVPENAALYVLKGDADKLINAAKASCNEAIDGSRGNIQNCLLIDCVSRVLYLGDDFDKEIKEACDTLMSKHPDMHVEGLLSLGEISTFKDGSLSLYNKTFLTTLLYNEG